MKQHRSFLSLTLIALLLSGCAGVPKLYEASESSTPTVDDIANHLACEVKTAMGDPAIKAKLAAPSYYITALLTLQVDDSADLTPSLGFIHPLSGASFNVTTTVAGDIGRARRRTFTTTYTMDSTLFAKNVCDGIADKVRWFRLDGNLGMKEVISNGLDAVNRPDVHQTDGSGDKSAPSFGSLIQFTITKSLTGLGPLWTIKRFKGPSGSNGLVNAKLLDTDSVIVTFAPQKTGTGVAAGRQKAADDRMTAASQGQEEADADARDKAAQLKSARAHLAALQPALAPLSRAERARIAMAQARVNELTLELQEARMSQLAAAVELDAAIRQKEQADRATAEEQAGSVAALNATQNLQTTILLQNLLNAPGH